MTEENIDRKQIEGLGMRCKDRFILTDEQRSEVFETLEDSRERCKNNQTPKRPSLVVREEPILDGVGKCRYWDSGWCYKPDSEYAGCVGNAMCKYMKEEG